MSVRPASLLLAIALGALCTGPAAARSTDRSQPMDIQAGHQSGSVDYSQPTTLSDGVKIDQGTLHIDADRAVISFRNGEASQAVLTGNQAVLKQQMDDGSPMTATADRIDYDMLADVVVLTGNYTVTTQRGSTSGQRLTYNLKSGQVDSGGQDGGRVKMRILPKSQRTQN
ncbi:lipopolysaccharide transport periplasmic protein LptA [Pseudoluteimonas lycopersici]|uniref:Lipopolysaccharide transport periplasmic protein LptA n=1 Tax=Pseudoluteimonas lycopersici TaxID=1324796 RepID=A0A516V4N1_9GAMM|nr:lipopolysaccharide transport periplasmic protein LptA [Lysobacter lycopersici]QDQ73500.1 lipopolysaccharide transport periplasmic protein LptA [Lysobacter lycopersici]